MTLYRIRWEEEGFTTQIPKIKYIIAVDEDAVSDEYPEVEIEEVQESIEIILP